jgi:hypothetical protein
MENTSYNIFCDMDGVLVDFEKGVIEKMNSELSKENPKEPKLAAKVIAELGRNYVTVDDIGKYSPGKSKASVSYMYALVHDDEEFWANLPWNKGGKQLWARIRHLNPTILTSPMDKRGKKDSLVGKKRWVERNLGIPADRIIFAHSKWDYALDEDGQPNVLIDDFNTKVDPWNERGGVGILHTSANNTIKILDTLEDL